MSLEQWAQWAKPLVAAGVLLGIAAAPSCKKSSSSPGATAAGTDAAADVNAPVFGPLSVDRYVLDGAAQPSVFVLTPLLTTRPDLAYANVAIDLDGDGKIEPSEWLSQNLLVGVVPMTYGFPVPLDPSVTTAAISVALSGSAVAAPWDGTAPSDGVLTTATPSITSVPISMPPIPQAPYVGGGGGNSGGGSSGGANGAGAPNPDQGTVHILGGNGGGTVQQVQYDDYPNTHQGTENTCVSHSIASSLGWMARKYNFACKFNYAGWLADGGIDMNSGVNGGNVAMTNDVAATYVDAGLFHADAGGVSPTDIITGKNKFVMNNGLPVSTTRIPPDATDESGTMVFAGIQSALNAGCAVELVVHISSGDKSFNHMVAVTGYSVDANGNQGITINDSLNAPPDPTEAPYGIPYAFSGSTISDYSYTNGNNKASAKFVFAVQECAMPAAATACGSSTAGAPPAEQSFSATFNQSCYCTTYNVVATDPTGGTLHYTWSDSNPCGQFMGGDSPTATWYHPDSTMPGACPDQAVHPGTITVVIKGGGGSLTCAYAGGSGNGSTVTCTPGP